MLNDPNQRAEYDRDLKKYGIKDGQGLQTHKHFMKQNTIHQKEKENKKNAPPQPEPAPKRPSMSSENVEIPANIDGLTVKELKNLLDKLGVKRDDCFEKDDLINRLKEHKNGPKK